MIQDIFTFRTTEWRSPFSGGSYDLQRSHRLVSITKCSRMFDSLRCRRRRAPSASS